MNWERGFTAAYHACLVDPVTWEDIESFDIMSGNINRTSTD